MRKNRRECKESDEANVTVKFLDETLVLKNVFISGRGIVDEDPVGVYSGSLDLAEMGISLMTMFRAVLRTTREEMGISTEIAEDFIIFTLAEAIKRENEEDKQQAIADFVNEFFNKKY